MLVMSSMSEEDNTISKYFVKQHVTSPHKTPKRMHPSTDTDSEIENSFSLRPVAKRQNMAEKTDDPIQASLKELFNRMGTLATKEDVQTMRDYVQKFTHDIMEKLDKMEGQILEVESKTAAVAKDIKIVKGKTTRLENNVNDHDIRLSRVEKEMNDLEQYTRRWNLRVYKVPEAPTGKTEDLTKRVCSIFTDLIGVKTVPQDVEVAHRAGRVGERARPVLVRFFDRKKRDDILQNRRKLKGKGFVVDEDLTVLNYKLLKKAQGHSATMSVWSSNGKILSKLKNGQIIKLNIHSDIDTVFERVMGGHNDSLQNNSS